MNSIERFPPARPAMDRLAFSGLDMLGVGFAVIGAGGRVLMANETCRSILSDAGRGLAWRSDALRARRRRDMRALDTALASAFTGGRSLLRVEDVAGDGALEMLAAGIEVHPGAAPCAAAVIREPEAAWPGADSLAQLYELTPAEAGLAEMLVRGVGLAAACEARGISVNTGKGYLKRIFEKTGARRQSELVAKVMQGVAPFSARAEAAAFGRTA
jgi:DNA-binding CsgD family transcriptional regulator